jgi:DNA helicase TIP49 (TBP-interacting protein)
MKRIKIILLCCIVFIISCKKTIPIVTEQPTNVEFFSLSENKVKNGDVININLTTGGVYTLTMIDTVQNQVVSRERFTGKVGLNSLKIFTNTLPTKNLSVVLKDQNNNQIGKTRIIIN